MRALCGICVKNSDFFIKKKDVIKMLHEEHKGIPKMSIVERQLVLNKLKTKIEKIKIRG